jgi:hypothetical protein
VLLQASARAYGALATSLQQAQQQAQELAAAQQLLQPDQQGVPVLDARKPGSSSQVRRTQRRGAAAHGWATAAAADGFPGAVALSSQQVQRAAFAVRTCCCLMRSML